MLKLRMIAVDITDWDPPNELFEKLLGLLHDDQAAARVRRYRHARDRLGNLLGRLVPLFDLCTSSSRYTWKQLAQHKEPKGRPFLVNTSTSDRIPYYDFNISHDGCMLLVASAYSASGEAVPFRLGADVMRLGLPDGIPSIPDFEETVKDLLAPAEKEILAVTAEEDKLDVLMHYWATKEAVSKAIGAGLSHPYEMLDSSSVRETGEMPFTKPYQACLVREWQMPSSEGPYLCVLALLEAGQQVERKAERNSLLQAIQIEQTAVQQLVDNIIRVAEGDS